MPLNRLAANTGGLSLDKSFVSLLAKCQGLMGLFFKWFSFICSQFFSMTEFKIPSDFKAGIVNVILEECRNSNSCHLSKVISCLSKD